jgi:hypothetical protein
MDICTSLRRAGVNCSRYVQSRLIASCALNEKLVLVIYALRLVHSPAIPELSGVMEFRSSVRQAKLLPAANHATCRAHT